MPNAIVTAAIVVIGDEILSGRTREANAHHLARVLSAAGIDLREIRVVADDHAAIVEAVNTLRARNTYLFTSGGIGPTHDDITAEAVAAALGRPFGPDPRAMAVLAAHYEAMGEPFTKARQRMARMPQGATLIDNPVSAAPGFVVDNVHVMAGVPPIFQAMLDNVLPTLKTGRRLLSQTIHCRFGEGVIGSALAAIDKAHPDALIGSYPHYEDGDYWVKIVIRAPDAATLDAARQDVEAMLEREW
ncbi:MULTISPECIES: molybdopterin-binding protein [unclassified Roseitalea]|uniref:competence/damage-inducible protein A n=1 Tax=unclassified Roseitalea TaxID=2639107 RepID=UPI00273E437C|nr:MULTISPECIES: molybdopterin-binding protein [unclassified Roseitalea]